MVKTVAGEVAFLHKDESVGGNWVEIQRNGSKAIGLGGEVRVVKLQLNIKLLFRQELIPESRKSVFASFLKCKSTPGGMVDTT